MRAFAFVTRWTLDASAAECWAVLADPSLSWPVWWSGMTGDVVELGRPTQDHVGSRARLRFRSPLGFPLRIELTLAAASPPSSATFDVSGDLTGCGRVTLAGVGGRTLVMVRWDVATTRWWMSAAGRFAGPVFGWSHAHVMRRGERGLASYLARAPGSAGPVAATRRQNA